jgi:hypothetical protein
MNTYSKNIMRETWCYKTPTLAKLGQGRTHPKSIARGWSHNLNKERQKSYYCKSVKSSQQEVLK